MGHEPDRLKPNGAYADRATPSAPSGHLPRFAGEEGTLLSRKAGEMSATPTEGASPPGQSDVLTAFSLPTRNARGRIVRLGPTLSHILAAHAYPPPLARLLADALVHTALLGAMLRPREGQLTLQIQAKGAVVDLIVCDWRDGKLRGYLRHDAERLGYLGKNPSLKALLGRGYLAITLDQTQSAERYQGIVPLEGTTLAQMVETYFAQSEQLPTLIRTASEGGIAGGLIVQHLARRELDGERLSVAAEHPDWDHVRALASTIKPEELTDATLPLDALLWRLFNEDEVRALPPIAIGNACRCSVAHFATVLARFPEEERAEMRGEDGLIGVDCEFCATSYRVAV